MRKSIYSRIAYVFLTVFLFDCSLYAQPVAQTCDFDIFDTTNGLGSNQAFRVFVSDGRIWVGTLEGLSFSDDGGQNFTNLTTADGLAGNFVEGLFVSGDTIYAGSKQGLSISFDNGANWIIANSANGLFGEGINDVFVDNGVIYTSADPLALGISRDTGQTWTQINSDSGVGFPAFGSFEVHANGDNIYVATSGGLAISNDGGTSWISRTTADGLPGDFVFSVFEKDGTIYVGTLSPNAISISTDNGVSWTVRDQVDGLPNALPTSINVNEDGVIYVGSNLLSVSTDSGATFQTFPNSGGFRQTFIDGNTIYGSEQSRGLLISNNCAPIIQKECMGPITLTNQTEVDAFDCTSVVGDVIIDGTTSGGDPITNLDALAFLTSVTGNLTITQTALTDVNGTIELAEVGGNLTISNNISLANLSGFPKLETVTGNLSVTNNAVLLDISGFPNLMTVGTVNFGTGGPIQLRGPSVGLRSTTGCLVISNNGSLTQISGLNNLMAIQNALEISNNASLMSLAGLVGLIQVGQDLIITNNNALPNLDGLDNLQQVGGMTSITLNPVNVTGEDYCALVTLIAGQGDMSGNTLPQEALDAINSGACSPAVEELPAMPWYWILGFAVGLLIALFFAMKRLNVEKD